MPDRELMTLVFAPATVGLVVMACRRTPCSVYLATLVGVLALTLAGLGRLPLGPDGSMIGHWVFGMVFIVVPTLTAFGVGRLIALDLGGAYVFAASCTAYMFGLGMAAGIVSISQMMTP